MKHLLRAAAVAAAFGIAGCGGGDEANGPLSYSDYGDRLSDICGSAGAELNAAKAKAADTGTAADFSAFAKQFDEVTTEVEALDPPAELDAAAADYIAAREAELATYEQAEQAAADGDAEGQLKVLQKADRAETATFAAASKLGATNCVPTS